MGDLVSDLEFLSRTSSGDSLIILSKIPLPENASSLARKPHGFRKLKLPSP
jgi:hypothetical protein